MTASILSNGRTQGAFGMAGGQSATWPADRCTGGKLQAWFDALAPVPLIV